MQLRGEKLQYFSGAIVDIDDFLTQPGVNVWYELTKQIYLLAGASEQQALEAINEHGRIYHEFKAAVKNIDKRENPDEYAEAYQQAVEGIKQLYERSGLPLNRQNLTHAVEIVIEENILQNPETYNFLLFLQELQQAGYPVIVLTGAYSLIAEKLSEVLGFSGGFAATDFNWREDDFEGIEYNPDSDTNKVDWLILTSRMFPLVEGAKDEIFAFDDGGTAGELFKYTVGFQLVHPGEQPLRTARYTAHSLAELQVQAENTLPDSVHEKLARLRHSGRIRE